VFWTAEFFYFLITIAIIAAGILLLPVVTRDRHSNLIDLQYSSKAGRRILRTQFAAYMTSAFIAAVVIFGGVTALFLARNAVFYERFYNQQIASLFWGTHLPWFDITYLQFVGIGVALGIVVITAAAGLFFLLSVYSRNYVMLALKAVPAIVLFAQIGNRVVFYTLMFQNPLYAAIPVVGIEFIVSGFVLVASTGLCVFACKQAARKEVL
jgi:hypothetical protein